MSDIYFTSDNHWSHKNIIKHSNRPYADSIHMDEALIKKWNATVSPGDIVYCLGDWSFASLARTISITGRLFGEKHLILGNHDKQIIQNREVFLAANMFASIQTYKQINVAGHKINLFHYGCRVWDGSHKGYWQLFGHSHGTLPPHGKSVDVGVDSPWVTGQPEYRPFTFAEVKRFMDKQQQEVVDHHGSKRDE